MSKATKRKYVTQEVLGEFVLPKEDNEIVRITASRGNNLHEVETAKGDKFLVSMPTKFRRNVWIKRGDYVMTIPIEEGDKVKAEISHILYKEQIKYIKEEGLWPKEFDDELKCENDSMIPDDMLPPSDDDEYSDSDDEATGQLNANPNRATVQYIEEDSDSEDEDDEEEDCTSNSDVKNSTDQQDNNTTSSSTR